MTSPHSQTMRRFLAYTLLPLLLILALGLNLWLARRHAAPALPPPVAAHHGQRLSNIDLGGLAEAEVDARMAAAVADGNTVIRLRLPWDQVQPQPDSWQWQALHHALRSAAAHNLQVLLLLDGSPAWARASEDADNPLAPPRDSRDFGRFAAEAARQAGDQVIAYQIWNEPNIAPHWGARWVDAAAYTRLLREAALSIHSVDPQAQIVLATLAPTTAQDGANLSDVLYLQDLYQHGAGAWFDAAGMNALGFDAAPTEAPAIERLNFRRPELLADIMAQHGDADKEIWITAWGWWTPASGFSTSPWGALAVDELATAAPQAWQWAQQHWPWAGAMGWMEDWPAPTADPLRAGFALRDATGQRTRAGEIVSQLRPATVIGAGRWPLQRLPQPPGPDWRLSSDAADPAEPAAKLHLRWQGRALALTVQGGDYWGTIQAWIDGQPAPALPHTPDGTAYLLLYDPEQTVRTIPLLRDASAGEHELTLEVKGGWGQWPLREIVVLDDSWPAPWPFWPFTAALLLALAASVGLWWRVARRPPPQILLGKLLTWWEHAEARFATWRPAWHVPLALLLTLAFYLAPRLDLSLALLALLALLLALRLELAPWLILPSLPFYTYPKLLGPVGLPLHELLIWLATGIALTRWLLARMLDKPTTRFDATQAWSNLDWPLAALLLVGALAMLGAQRFGFALYDWRVTLLTPALFYFLLTRLKPRTQLLPAIGDALAFTVVLLALLGLRQLWLGQAFFAEGVPRIAAVYGSPNNLALVLGRVWPMLVVGAWLGPDERRGFSARRLLYVASFLLGSLLALLTFSKGLLLISMPIALILLALNFPRLRRPIAGLAVVGALALLPFLGTKRFRDLLNLQSGTTFLRLQLWQSAWQMWRQHPWFGVGPDNFLYAYRSTYALPAAWEELNLSHPHNLILDLLTRTGIFGLAAGLALIIHIIRQGLLWRHKQRLLAGLWIGLLAGLAHGMIDNSLFLADLAVLTMLVAALLQRIHRLS